MIKHFLLLACWLVFMSGLRITYGANPQQIKDSIAKGVSYLQSRYDETPEPSKAFVGLAMYKGGLSKDSPMMKKVIAHVLEKFENDQYKPGHEHIYEAGVEATLLADIDPVQYEQQLRLLTDYIISWQMDNGGWDYPHGGHPEGSVGDTSVMQYAALGLWAAGRAGIEVPPKVWEKILLWHSRFQNQDGGFAYCPGLQHGEGKGGSTLNMTVNAIGSMHIAMLQLDPKFFPLKTDSKPAAKPQAKKEDGPKFGVLETVQLDEVKKVETASIPPTSVQSVRKAFSHFASRFTVDNQESGAKSYYYYSLERMAALADVEAIGGHDWYGECADFLLQKQNADGSWPKMSIYWQSENDTAFCVLFLTRSTGKLLKRTIGPKYGDGLLAGGRGLPDDLSDVNFDGRSVKGKEKPKGPLDELLASLTTSGAIDVADVQEQIVEKVQLGDREELVKQIDTLVKLIDHPQAEVRRTAAWALGRTDNMELAQHLINLLNDSDLGVMLEARRALCWLSRKPKGFGLPDDPLEELPANATKQQQRDAITNWHKKAVLLWGEWYLYNRPFEERGDEFEAILRAKMEGLKSGV